MKLQTALMMERIGRAARTAATLDLKYGGKTKNPYSFATRRNAHLIWDAEYNQRKKSK